MKHVWQAAASLAARAHDGQRRKDARTPFVAHPMRVALTVAGVFGCTDPVVIAIALLHDVIEDTTTDYDELAEEFGDEVARGVAALTKNKSLPEPEREREYDARIGAADWRARLVKLADCYDNYSDAETAAAYPRLRERARRAIDLARVDATTRPEIARGIASLESLLSAAT